MALHDSFRANVRKRRLELNMTQAELAQKMGLSRPYIAEVELGRRVPTLDTVEKFGKALDCPAVSLLLAEEIFSKH